MGPCLSLQNRLCVTLKNRRKDANMKILSIMPVNSNYNLVNRDNRINTNNTNCMCRSVGTTKVNLGFSSKSSVFKLIETLAKEAKIDLPSNFAEGIDGKLFVGGAPTEAQLEILKKGGITSIINMCKEKHEGIASFAKKLGLDCLFVDRHERSIVGQDYQEGTHLYGLLQLIKEILSKNAKVIITCDKGEGASRSLAKEYMVKVEGWDIGDAADKLPYIN